jgi:hypothetical protein
MTLFAGQLALWLSLGISGALLVVITAVALFVGYYAVFQDPDEDIADVQRFIELTDDARRLVTPGLPLFDRDKAAAASAAIGRFQTKKAEARRALWASQSRRLQSRGAR